MLRNGVYSYEYIDNCKKFSEIPIIVRFLQSHKYAETTDADYTHEKRVWKDFEMKIIGEYHGLYVQSNTLLLADVFGKFRNICLEIYEFSPACFLAAPGLAWKADLKRPK